MKTLTQKELKKLLDYDPDTGVFTWNISIGRVDVGDVAGHINGIGYRVIGLRGKRYLAHRLAWLYVTGEFPSNQIVHVNYIRDDNMFSNLRVVTHSESMKNEILTQELLKKLLHYDPETGVFTCKIGRGAAKYGSVAGGIEAYGYVGIRIHYKRHKAHRLAWLYMTGEFPAHQIDHINHIRDDNRFSNLREVTPAENSRNVHIRKVNVSGVNGVHWDKLNRKWKVSIGVNGKHIHGGYFNCITAAALTRKALDVKYGFHKNHGICES